MTYLEALDRELESAGIPRRRRSRIVTEISDHLHEDPKAELGAPDELARQFADELGTRLARETALRAFLVLAVLAVVLVEAFFDGGRTWAGWVGYLGDGTEALPSWYEATVVVCVIAAQVALAAGGLAALRAYRLRRIPVISAADARVLNRRAAVGLLAGAVTMAILPLSLIPFGGDMVAGREWWAHPLVAIACVVLPLVMLPDVLRAARLRPSRAGAAGDLTDDLGSELSARLGTTPLRLALALCGVIVVVLAVIGAAADDPIDGVARGLADALACIVGFLVLGGYLGLSGPARGRPVSG